MNPVKPPVFNYEMNRNRKWSNWDTIKHELGAVWSGNRFNCPRCTAIGTMRAHGAISNGGGHRRWLCKFCGYYCGSPAADPTAEGEYQCYPHESGVWSGDGPGKTPTPLERCWPLWPWR